MTTSNDPVKGLNMEWFRGLDTPEAKRNFALKIRSLQTDIISKRLIAILKDKERSLVSGAGLADYDCPSWAHKQADVNGQLRSLRYVIELLTPHN